MSSPEQKRKSSNSMWDTKLIAAGDLDSTPPVPSSLKDQKNTAIKDRGSKQNGEGKVADANYSPSDFVIKILLDEFKTQTRKKIDEIMKFGIDEKFLLSDILESDPKMHHLINSMAELSKYHLSVLIDELLTWRASLTTDVSSRTESNSQKVKLTKEYILVEERNKLAIEFIFCKIVLLLLENNLTKESLEEGLSVELELLAFKYLKPPERKEGDVDDSTLLQVNRLRIPMLYSKILGSLSQFRFKDIAHQYVKEITSNPVRSKKAIYVIQGIRYLRFQLSSQEGVEQAVWFLSKLHLLFKAAQRSEVRQALAELFVKFLRPYAHFWIKIQQPGMTDKLPLLSPLGTSQKIATMTAPTPRPAIDFSTWFAFLKSTFESFALKKLKTKELMATFPLMTVVLCACKAQDFTEHFYSFTEKLLHVLKDAKLRPVALECILYLLETYLVSSDGPDVTKYLLELSSVVFSNISSTKRVSNQQPIADSFTVFVDIICIIAHYKLHFAVENVLFELLTWKGDNFQAENVMVAVRVIERLLVNAPYLGKDKSATAKTQEGLSEYIPKLSQSLSSVLLTLDQSLGNYLLTQAKPLSELAKTDKDFLMLELTRTLLSCLPKIIPSKIPLPRLMNIFSRYLIHLDKGISDKATGTLSRLMKERPDFRANIIYALSDFILSIPHNRYDLIFSLLFKQGQLLKQWIESLKSGDTAVPRDASDFAEVMPTLPLEKIEAFAIVYLCSPKAKIRLLSLEILRSLRTVSDELKQDKTPRSGGGLFVIPSTRVMDVIDETGNDVVKDLHTEINFLRPVRPTAKSVDRIVSRESREDQLVWSYSLAGLMKYILELCPDAAQHTWSLISARIHPVQPEESDRNLTVDEQEEMLVWWRNYIIVACATVSLNDLSFESKKKDSNVAYNPRELFMKIIPFLKSSFESYREAAIMAMQRANYNVYEILFDTLRPYARDFEDDKKPQKKSKTKRDRFRYEMILIYSNIAEHMRPGTLSQSSNLKQHYISFIQETCNYLTPNINPFGHLPPRYYFCLLVKYVARDLYCGGETMDNGLRKDLFYLMAKWCNIDEMLHDEATKKRLNSVLGPIKDADKRKAYLNLLKEHGIQLQLVAFQAIEALLAGPHFEPVGPNYEFFSWVSRFLHSEDEVVRRLARYALESFLDSIAYKSNILAITIAQCYSPDWDISSAYFLSLVELYTEEKVQCSEVELLQLIIYKMGDRNYNVRRRAQDLLVTFKSLVKQNDKWQKMSLAVESGVDETNERAQLSLSTRLAKEHMGLVCSLIEEMVLRLEAVDERGKRQMLTCLVPWLENLDLKTLPGELLQATIEHLLLITLKYSTDHAAQIEQIWFTVAKSESNVILLINKLLDIGNVKKNFEFIDLASTVIIYLGRTCSKLTVDTLVPELSKLYRSETVPSAHIKSLSNTSNSGDMRSAPNSSTMLDSFNTLSSSELKRVDAFSEPTSLDTQSSVFRTQKSRSDGGREITEESPSKLALSGESRGELVKVSSRSKLPRPSVSSIPERPPKVKTRRGSISDSSGAGRKRSIKDEESLSSSEVVDIESSESSVSRMGSKLSGFINPLIIPEIHFEEPKLKPLAMYIPSINDADVHRWGLSRGHLALVFLAQLTYEVVDECKKHLPIIFQLAFLGMDYPQSVVYENCRIILLNLVQNLIVTPMENSVQPKSLEQKNVYEEAVYLVQFLRAKAGKQLWTNEEITLKKTEIRSTQELTDLVQAMCTIFGTDKETVENWASQALGWALSGLSMHIRSRSYQIYRALSPSLNREAMNELLESLLTSISEVKRSENRALALEILYTLQSIVKSMDAQKLILFPQIFWSAAALLHMDYEQHYFNALKLLCQLFDKLNFNDKYIQNVFSASIPKDWDPPFKGLQPLILKGLFSSISEEKAIEVLSKLTLLPCDPIVHADAGRAIVNLIALLPWIITMASKGHLSECAKALTNLTQLCTSKGWTELGDAFKALGKSKSSDGFEQFMNDLRKAVPKVIYPDYCYFTFTFLFAMLEEGVERYHKAVLQLLQLLLQDKSIVVQLSTLPPSQPALETSSQQGTSSPPATPLAPIVHWVVQMCKQLQGPHWELALPILSKYMATESTNVEITSNLRSSRTLSSMPKLPMDLNQFLNKPGKGVSHTAINLDKVLSTESRKRSQLDQSTLSLVSSEDNSGSEESLDSDSSVDEDQLGFLLNEKEAEQEDIDNFTNTNFGRFPTFRGFDDLLAKLDSMPQEAKDKDRDRDRDRESKDKDKDHGKDKDKESKDKGDRSEKSDRGDKDKMPLPPSPRKQPAGVPTRANPPSPSKQYQRSGSPTAAKKYPTNGSDFSDSGSQSGGSSPSGTMRRKLAISFDTKLLKTTKKWRRLAAQKTFPHTAEMFTIFPIVNQLMDLLQVDYKSTYQNVFKVFKTAVKSQIYSPALKGDNPLYNSLLKQIPDMMFSLVSTKYNQRLRSDSSYQQMFIEQRAKLIQDFTQQQMSYTEGRVRVEEIKTQLNEGLSGEDQILVEKQLALTLCNLHSQLLQCTNVYLSLQQLVQDILKQETTEDLEVKFKIVAEELRKNREVADKISGNTAPAIEVATQSKSSGSKSDTIKSTSKTNK